MDIDKLEKLFDENIKDVSEGYQIWSELVSEYKIGDDSCVVLFPANDKELNYTALRHLNRYMEHQGYCSAYLLTHDTNIIKRGKEFSDKIKEIIEFPRKEAEKLMKFYITSCDYMTNFYVCSLNEPPMRDLAPGQEFYLLSLDEVVCHWIYRLPTNIEKETVDVQPW